MRQNIFLLAVLLTPAAFGETTFTMLDGQEVTVPQNMTSADLEDWIKRTNEAMFANSGGVGLEDSLSLQRGSDIVKNSLKRLLRDIALQDRLIENRDRVALDNEESKGIRRGEQGL
jgi:hypothetical protein